MKPESQNPEENAPEQDTRQILLQAADGLLYPSESDYPFEYVEWASSADEQKELTGKDFLQLIDAPAKTPVKTLTLDDFFAYVTQQQDWHGEEEKETTARFIRLKEVLEKQLTDIQVFKVGKIEIDAYIIGRTADNKWAGLSTVVVET